MGKKVLILLILVLISAITLLMVREVKRIRTHLPTAWLEDMTADCAVVLTGGPHRAREGLDLLAQKNVKKLIITGTNPTSDIRMIFPEWPYYGDIRENDVILEKHSQTTYGNAQQAQAIVEALGCNDLILITSQIHMYRAYRTFRVVFPSDYPIYQRAVVGDTYQPDLMRSLEEAFKALFYRFLWWVFV